MNRELLKKNYEKHGFLTSFFDSKEEAAEYLKDRIRGKKIAFGGSLTVKEMRLDEILQEENEIIWHWKDNSRETRMAARESQVYICSVNGASETGELVNIDGTGNRVSQTLYGPEKVYFVIGKNKLAGDLSAAVSRAKNVAAPKNAARLKINTPCAANGGDRCYDCDSPERICRATVILERPCREMEAEVVFIDEELGY